MQPRRRQINRRSGMSLMEVIAGLTLLTLLCVPMIGLLTSSARLWRQYESGHGSVSHRQTAMQELIARLQNSSRLLSISNTQLRFQSQQGDTQRVFFNRGTLYWDHAGTRDILAENVGSVRFRRVANGGSPQLGTLIEVQLQNGSGAGVANARSSSFLWIRPTI